MGIFAYVYVNCQKEIWVFIVLFRIRLFHFPILKHFREQVPIFIFFQDWAWDFLCYPLVEYMRFLSKLCWWWPIYLAVGDSAGDCGAKCSVETQAFLVGASDVCTGAGWLVSPFEQTFNFCTGSPQCRASGCLWRGRAWGDEWASFFLYIHCRGRLLLGVCVSLCQQDSRNGGEATGVTDPDVRSTHCWHGAVNSEKEIPDDHIMYHKISSKNQIWSCI